MPPPPPPPPPQKIKIVNTWHEVRAVFLLLLMENKPTENMWLKMVKI